MTNAWVQRILILGSMAAFWWLAAALLDSHPLAALVCIVVPFLITPSVLAVSCLLAASANRLDAAPRASLADWLRAWAAECRVSTKVFSWWQPFRHQAIANHLPATPGKRGMVLVHGFFCNRALWTDWMIQLKADGRAFVAVDLEPAYGSVSDYAQIVEQAIAQVEKATGLPPVIVGHSMGGLAIRAWAAQFASSTKGLVRIHQAFTLGTPHQGTALANLSLAENSRQMRQTSDWLANNASQLPDGFTQLCTCFHANCDNIVFPCHAATLQGADNRFIAGRAHVELVFVDEIKQACWAALK
jgi:triacylglycerol lipase